MGGLWTWAIFLILALSALDLNLHRKLSKPAVAAVTTLTPTPFDLRPQRPVNQPIERAILLLVGYNPFRKS